MIRLEVFVLNYNNTSDLSYNRNPVTGFRKSAINDKKIILLRLKLF